MESVFSLVEEPPKWYDIAAVIALGVVQVVAGVLAKTFIPVAGQLIREFLISTGVDGILFGIQCAITGEFSLEKYWAPKKRSMITGAITSVVTVGFGFIKNASKAWQLQKLSHESKLKSVAKAMNTSVSIARRMVWVNK